jgi:hypothetical protein
MEQQAQLLLRVLLLLVDERVDHIPRAVVRNTVEVAITLGHVQPFLGPSRFGSTGRWTPKM